MASFFLNYFFFKVLYDVRNFLAKNKDTIYADLIQLMHGSKNEFIRSLFDEQEQTPQKKEPKPALPKKTQSKKITLASQFRVSP